jgi:4-amino-4-deoxy-L-arabinose transferase-like glycosyltransferase
MKGIKHKNSKKACLVLAGLFTAITAFHLWSLLRYPAPFVDEAWNAGRAWELPRTGRAFGTMDLGVIEQFDGYWTFFPWLPAWLQSLALRLSDTPSIYALRTVSLAFGLILLVAMYSVGSRLGRRSHGLLCILLLSVSGPFLIHWEDRNTLNETLQ